MKTIEIVDNFGSFTMVGTTTLAEATERLGVRAGMASMQLFAHMHHTHCDLCQKQATDLKLVANPNVHACKACRTK